MPRPKNERLMQDLQELKRPAALDLGGHEVAALGRLGWLSPSRKK